MAKPQVILEDLNPNGNITAIVEQDDRVAYLSLHPAEETEIDSKACWVRNLQPAPAELDDSDSTKRPLLPERFCRHPEGAAPLQAESLRLVWFEEGDGAALVEGSELLVVIPAWSGTGGFHGYARDCLDKNELCWPLGEPDDTVLYDRVARAAEHWTSWRNPGPRWEELQHGLMSTLEQALGKHSNYYVIDGGYWPPKALIRVPADDHVCLVTIGVSIRPQPTVELTSKRPQQLRRIELGCCLATPIEDRQLMQLTQYLSAQSNLPWSRYTWLGDGHTVPCDVLPPNPAGPPFTSVLLLEQPVGAPAITLPSYRGDQPRLLWLVPITAAERELAMNRGSELLASRLEAAGIGWKHQPRPEVDLSP